MKNEHWKGFSVAHVSQHGAKCDLFMQKLIIGLVLLVFAPAHASTFFVTDAVDTTNVTSLRGAVIAANASGGDNVIILTNGVYPLTISGANEDAGFTGDLDVTNGSLTIVGASSSQVVVDATGLGDRVFEVFPNVQLTLIDLTIIGGMPPVNSGGGGGIYNSGLLTMNDCMVISNSAGDGAMDSFFEGAVGGGIYNSGWCFLNNCIVNGNSSGRGNSDNFPTGFGAEGGDGGGIWNSGMLTLIYCTLSGNATGSGGTGGNPSGIVAIGSPGGWGGVGGNGAGLYNTGEVWLSSCTISSNSCGGGGDGGQGLGGTGGTPGIGGSGGGIYNAATLNLSSCTVGNNSCGNGGVGGGPGDSEMDATAVSGAMGGSGGGIYNGGTLSMIASTIAQNLTGSGGDGGSLDDYNGTAPAATGGSGGNGGGVLNCSSNATVFIHDTLMVLNVTGNGGSGGTNYSGAIGTAGLPGSGSDGSGIFVSQGFNLIGQGDGLTGITNALNSDYAGSSASPINPRLSPLQMNAGTTFTFALLPGSPAIDAGDDNLLGSPENLAVDQCGNPRKSGAHVDIGAFEYNGVLNGVVLSPLLTDSVTTTDGFQFSFNAATGLNYSIWASTDLITWVDLGSASEVSEGWFFYQDSDAVNHDHRFYQIRYP